MLTVLSADVTKGIDLAVLAVDNGASVSVVVTGVLTIVCNSVVNIVGEGLVVVSVAHRDIHFYCSHAYHIGLF